MSDEVSLSVYRVAVRQAALGRYRTAIGRKVPHELARNQSIAQTRAVDFPGLSARRIGIELDAGIEADKVRSILEGWTK
jgi:hypothetical protein